MTPDLQILPRESKFTAQEIHQAMQWARSQSWKVLNEIRSEIREGMSEEDAYRLALDLFAAHGVTKHWHRPIVRFGSGTLLNFRHPLQRDSFLKLNDPFYIDLGPVWAVPSVENDEVMQIEADIGDTFVFGQNDPAQRLIDLSRKLFAAGKQQWFEQGLSGKELYDWLNARVREEAPELTLAKEVAGHLLGEFPHQLSFKGSLAQFQNRPTGAWVLEIQLLHPELQIGAFFEDVLFQ